MLGVRGLLLILALGPGSVCSLHTRQNPAPRATASASPSQLDYPDSTSGLEHLIRDIMKAPQKNYDLAQADLLLKSLILPHPQAVV